MKLNKNIPLTINFELGRTQKSISSLLAIGKSTLFRLEDSKKDVVTIRIGEQILGKGKVLIQGGKMYIQVTELTND